jgi:hypothetical protein
LAGEVTVLEANLPAYKVVYEGVKNRQFKIVVYAIIDTVIEVPSNTVMAGRAVTRIPVLRDQSAILTFTVSLNDLRLVILEVDRLEATIQRLNSLEDHVQIHHEEIGKLFEIAKDHEERLVQLVNKDADLDNRDDELQSDIDRNRRELDEKIASHVSGLHQRITNVKTILDTEDVRINGRVDSVSGVLANVSGALITETGLREAGDNALNSRVNNVSGFLQSTYSHLNQVSGSLYSTSGRLEAVRTEIIGTQGTTGSADMTLGGKIGERISRETFTAAGMINTHVRDKSEATIANVSGRIHEMTTWVNAQMSGMMDTIMMISGITAGDIDVISNVVSGLQAFDQFSQEWKDKYEPKIVTIGNIDPSIPATNNGLAGQITHINGLISALRVSVGNTDQLQTNANELVAAVNEVAGLIATVTAIQNTQGSDLDDLKTVWATIQQQLLDLNTMIEVLRHVAGDMKFHESTYPYFPTQVVDGTTQRIENLTNAVNAATRRAIAREDVISGHLDAVSGKLVGVSGNLYQVSGELASGLLDLDERKVDKANIHKSLLPNGTEVRKVLTGIAPINMGEFASTNKAFNIGTWGSDVDADTPTQIVNKFGLFADSRTTFNGAELNGVSGVRIDIDVTDKIDIANIETSAALGEKRIVTAVAPSVAPKALTISHHTSNAEKPSDYRNDQFQINFGTDLMIIPGAPTSDGPGHTRVPVELALDHGTNPFIRQDALVANLVPKAPLDSPVFVGTPTAPTPINEPDNGSERIATTAWVRANAPDISDQLDDIWVAIRNICTHDSYADVAPILVPQCGPPQIQITACVKCKNPGTRVVFESSNHAGAPTHDVELTPADCYGPQRLAVVCGRCGVTLDYIDGLPALEHNWVHHPAVGDPMIPNPDHATWLADEPDDYPPGSPEHDAWLADEPSPMIVNPAYEPEFWQCSLCGSIVLVQP